MSSEKLESPDYLYKLCNENKWDGAREYLKRSDLSNDIKKQQICWKNDDGFTTFNKACNKKAQIDIKKSMISITFQAEEESDAKSIQALKTKKETVDIEKTRYYEAA